MVNIRNIISNLIKESITNNTIWYHGSPDGREIKQNNTFEKREKSVEMVTNLSGYYGTQDKLIKIRKSDGMSDKYFKVLDTIDTFKTRYKYIQPVFFTDSIRVARTYVTDKSAWDYQNSEPMMFRAKIDSGKNIKIIATGDRFRFISSNKVRQGFINSGITEQEFNEALYSFVLDFKENSGIRTDDIAILGSWFDIDTIDVVGVLDSYRGGNIKSTVRMVLNLDLINII